jgi:membrane fusion protein
MTGDLFRQEVLEARKVNWLGDISLARPLGVWVITSFSVGAALLICAVLILGDYTRRSTVFGVLVPDMGLSTVVAPASGVIGRLYIEEGATLRVGDPLAYLQMPRVTGSGDDSLMVIREGLDLQEASLIKLDSARRNQIESQMAGLSKQLSSYRNELSQIEREIRTRREQIIIAQDTIKSYESVIEKQYVSREQFNQRKQFVLDLIISEQSLERQATSIRRGISQIEQQLLELPSQRDISKANSDRDLATLMQERVRQEYMAELLIKAPVAGLVSSRLIEAGQAVQVGQPLFSLLPTGSRLRAQLQVPSKSVGFINPGDRVLLRYQSYPYQKFGQHAGRVIRISRNAIIPDVGAAPTAEPYYRVLVELDSQSIDAYGKVETLRPGMLLEADILGERRKLYEWVFEPLYSLTRKFD